MREETRRKEIIRLLSQVDEPITAKEIAHDLGMRVREVRSIYNHLDHVAKSVRSNGKRLLMVPPRCKVCGYVFENIKKARRPHRCPKCRSERIEPPRFIIR
jgi:hypothetical protein